MILYEIRELLTLVGTNQHDTRPRQIVSTVLLITPFNLFYVMRNSKYVALIISTICPSHNACYFVDADNSTIGNHLICMFNPLV